MGLKAKQRNVNYLSIREGKLTMEVKEATETSVARVVTKGKREGQTIHEEKFDQITGFLTSVSYEDKKVPFQNEPWPVLNIVMEDDGEIFKIEVPLSSSYAKCFITRLESIDFEEELEINTHWIEGYDAKFRGFISIRQDGEKLIPNYAKEDLPQIHPITNKAGKTVAWDDDELITFYKAVIAAVQHKTKVSGHNGLSRTNPAPSVKKTEKALTSESGEDDEPEYDPADYDAESDDLPF